jgi:spermidine/putrescine transport system substrate-binding protein
MMPMVPGRAKVAGPINYFTWGGYDDPAFFKNFQEKHGSLPDFSFFASEDEGLAKVRAGFKPSVGHPCSDTFPRWVRAGVTEGMDKSRLEHWDDLWPEVANLSNQYDENGNVLFAPFDWGNSSVAFRTDLAPEYVGNHSWEILFDPKYSGRLAQYNAPVGASVVAGLTLGIPREDLFKPNDAQIAAIRAKMAAQQPLIRFYWDDQTTAEQGLASGELVAAYSWNEAPVRLKRAGVPVEYMNPKEGILFWVCGLTKFNADYGTGDDNAVYDMVNEMQSPEVGKYIYEEWGYGHSNKKSFELADKAILAEVNLSEPQAMMNSGVFFQDVPDDINTKLQAMFEEVKAGL